MVLHHGDNDLVTVAQLVAKRRCNKIDSLRCAAREDDFLRRSGVEELPHALTGALLTLRRLLRQLVHAAVHVGFHRVVHIVDSFHHASRSLRCGC